MSYPLRTDRLSLRPFTMRDLPDFAALHAEPRSMRDYGLTLSPEQSHEKLSDYIARAQEHGIGRLHVSDSHGFVGYVGVNMTGDHKHPLGLHHEIGWRLLPRGWGKGYATEAARHALCDAFARQDIGRILAYTAPDNLASQTVIQRLGLTRCADMDFTENDPILGEWAGLVWCAKAADWIMPPSANSAKQTF
jgi:RimJ/RimL family protein N-acetyltransferase